MKLSVLIPWIPEHEEGLNSLIAQLKKQMHPDVEVLQLGGDRHSAGGKSTGKKRNLLLNAANGEYVVFVDADDKITEDYTQEIINAINLNPGVDCVCFSVLYCKNGDEKPVFYSSKYERDQNLPDHFLRLPNHLMVFKKEIAKRVGYQDVTFGEDADFAKRAKKYIKKEAHIQKTLYYYLDNK
jgi:glycosyltransferase involved in cell wall biosynthesis